MRFGQITAGRHLLWVKSAATSNDRAKEDWSTSPIREHGAVEEFRRSVATIAPGRRFSIPLSKSASREPSHTIRQYARLVHRWIESIGLERAVYGTHSMRRTKAAQIYRKTGNLRAVQLLLGHTKLESTVRYLGIEVDDALDIAEQIEL